VTLARELRLEFPAEVRILALEVEDARTIGGPVSRAVAEALPRLVERVVAQIEKWGKGVP
jgi:Ni,Fe-hydrogenase maturation factor